MKKILIALLSLLLLTACSKEITINFMIKGQTAFTVSGKSPITLNEEDFQITDEMVNLYAWLDQNGNPIDFSQPFKKNTTIYGDATFNYYIYFQANGQNYYTEIVEEGKTVSPPERIPTIDGFIFTGWLDQQGNLLDENTVCTQDTTYIAQYEETVEKIIIVNEVIEFDSPDSGWKRAGVTHNMGYPLTFTSSNPEVATYYDTHIFPHSTGECVFTITSESGIVKYLTVIVH
ncbi:MAG: InlB B-repeat-containing protein [Erysipelotrichaceae bacterium]